MHGIYDSKCAWLLRKLVAQLGETLPKDVSAKQRRAWPFSTESLKPRTPEPSRLDGEADRAGNNWARRLRFAFVCLALLVLAGSLYGQVGQAPGNILRNYEALKVTWLNAMTVAARRLFGILATIEFAWAAAILVLDKTDLQSWTSALIKRIMFIGGYFALLLNGRDWIDAIIKSFIQLGSTASGLPLTGTAPGAIFDIGLQMSSLLAATADSVGWFDHFATALALTIASILVLLSYVVITLTYIVTMIESYICVAAGYIFLGFGGSRWTAPYVERYISLTVAIGVKLMCLYLIIGGGIALTTDWINAVRTFGPATTIGDVWDIVGSSILFMGIAWMVPKFAASLLAGAPNFTAGDAVGPVASVVTVGATAVMAASAMAGKGLGLLGGGNKDAMPISQAANPGGAGGSPGAGGPQGPTAPVQPSAPGSGGGSGSGSNGNGGASNGSGGAGGGNVGSANQGQPAAPSPAFGGSQNGVGGNGNGANGNPYAAAKNIESATGSAINGGSGPGGSAGSGGGSPRPSNWDSMQVPPMVTGGGGGTGSASSPGGNGGVARVPPPSLSALRTDAIQPTGMDSGAGTGGAAVSPPSLRNPNGNGSSGESGAFQPGATGQVMGVGNGGSGASGPPASLDNPQTITNPQTVGSPMTNSSPMTVGSSGQVPPPSGLVKGLQLLSTGAALGGLVVDRTAAAIPGETPPSAAAPPFGGGQDGE